MSRTRWWLAAAVAFLTLVPAGGCASADEDVLEIVFTYGSEKQAWLTQVTEAFNAERRAVETAGGKKIVQVRLVAMGSGECMDALLGKYTPDPDKKKAGPKGELGADKAHLTSPASKAYIELGNAEWKRAGNATPLVALDKARDLVTSPIVIGMWKSRAEALGWPQKEIGWADLTQLSEKGWAASNQPQWGRFKLAHTHPEFSNSGLMSVLALAYAGAGKTEGLTVEDLAKPETRDFIARVEKSVEFYGQSTGFLKETLVERGPDGIHAGVLYESSVFEANDPAAKDKPAEPLVAIYPREGTLISQHPAGIVERDWVTPDHRKAAEGYIEFLMKPEQQKRAAATGFRPGVEGVDWDKSQFTAARGVDLLQPKKELEFPNAEVLAKVKQTFVEVKKPIRVVLTIDVSGSMAKDGKLNKAKNAAKDFVGQLTARDELSLLLFSTTSFWPVREPVAMTDEGKKKIQDVIAGLNPLDDTALYDAVGASVDELREKLSATPRDRVAVVVVLSDGADTSSKKFNAETLAAHIPWSREGASVRVFTIAYGKDAKPDVLKAISKAASGKQFDGKPEDIIKVLRSIVTEF